jgi:hypothetical protein
MRDLRLAEPTMLIGTSIPAKKSKSQFIRKNRNHKFESAFTGKLPVNRL